jgi:hypothetical protein
MGNTKKQPLSVSPECGSLRRQDIKSEKDFLKACTEVETKVHQAILIMRKMMERYRDSIMPRLLILVTMILLAVTFLGCHDPIVSDMEARNQEFGFFIEQELQRCINASQVTSGKVSLPPAQVADMGAERRELDRMIQSGEWQYLFD